MKHSMTIEENDLLTYVRNFLALNGVRPANELVFLGANNKPVTGLHLNIMCKAAPPLEECPVCQAPTDWASCEAAPSPENVLASVGAQAHAQNVTAVTEDPKTGAVTAVGPAVRRYSVAIDEEAEISEEALKAIESVILSKELGESLEAPSEITNMEEDPDAVEDDEGSLPSMQVLAAQSRTIQTVRERELAAQRSKNDK